MATRYQPDYLLHIILLVFLCAIPYSGILDHSWHLDDSGNIVNNTPLHITNLSPATLISTFYAHPENSGRLYRPVTNLSFALNWYLGQDRPRGYHLVNIIIHFCTAVLLYQCCLLLLQTPIINHSLGNSEQADIALLTASLWVIAPLHISAVTYIVQRMAQLATFFSISTLFFYLHARLTNSKSNRVLFLLSMLCCSFLGIASKENAILIFPTLLLVECTFFFQCREFLSLLHAKKLLVPVLFLLLFLACMLTWHYLGGHFTNYDHRNFTLKERLLTEPRILLFYLSQLFFPTTSRLSTVHDFPLSTSLITPWNTLPAILACTSLILVSFFRIHRTPILSFAILFFFLNHLVESTFIPLELVFEHRNLLPTLFFFLPIAMYVVTKIDNNNRSTKYIPVYLLIITCTVFLIQSGSATFEHNKTWKDEETLYRDAVSKAPHAPRAKLNLASALIEQGRYHEAHQLCEDATKLRGASRNKIIPIALYLKGIIAYKQGNLVDAVNNFQQAYSLRKDYTAAAEYLIITLVEQEQYEEALAIVTARYKQTENPKMLLLNASILLRQKKPSASLAIFQQAQTFYPFSSLIVAGEAKALILSGLFAKAEQLLAPGVSANDLEALLLSIENNLHAGSTEKTEKLLEQLTQTVPLYKLLRYIELSQHEPFRTPLNVPLLKEAFLKSLPPIVLQQ